MRFNWCACKAWLVAIALVGLSNHEAFSQAVIANNPLVMSQSYILNPDSSGASPHCFKIATLPVDNVGDDDHLHLVVNLNYGWTAAANASLDALFGNRGGFTYSYTSRGVPVSPTAKLVAYMNADTSVDIYLMFANVYATASYTVLETTEETVYTDPADLLGATPAGTLVFDSSSSNYPPSTFSGFNGNVGIGTTSPSAKLDVNGSVALNNNLMYLANYGNPTHWIQFNSASGNDMWNYWGALDFQSYNNGNNTHTLWLSGSGNVGIGTTNPSSSLEVNGNVKLTNGSGASITFADGTVQNTAWSGTLCGGDYAESVNVSGDHKRYEPGDVLVLSDDSGSDVSKSTQPYSTLVTGIYSTKPGVVGRRQAGAKNDSEIPMAMVGIVPTKVSAENGPIRRGDLLVTSSTEGYAMKGTDPSRMLGAIVGKALGSLGSGTGVIEVLVSLQ